MRAHRVQQFICGLLFACAAFSAAAQYPERPLRLIVPQAPGSATDTVARILAPDGYTIGMGPIGALAITRHMVAKLPYEIERDQQPIALVARGARARKSTEAIARAPFAQLADYYLAY